MRTSEFSFSPFPFQNTYYAVVRTVCMVKGNPKRHNGQGHGGTCNTFYDGEICVKFPQGGGCSAMSQGEAVELALELLSLAKEVNNDKE